MFDDVILDMRNKVVLAKLKDQISYGKKEEIVVVYGAAHMPGIETNLATDFGYKPDKEQRLTAFSYE